MRFFIGIALCLGLVCYALGQTENTARINTGLEENRPWPPARGTVKFIGDPAPWPPAMLNKPPLERLCQISDLVIDGTVATVFPSRSPSRGTIQTDFLISVSQVFKGSDTLRQVMVAQMGGTIGDFHLLTDQYALMQTGKRYILFLQNDNRPSTPRSHDIPPYYVTRSWAGLGRVVEGKIQLGTTAPGELTSYDGTDVESLAIEIKKLVSQPGR